MKAPGEDMDITQIVRQEPQVYLSWWPTRPDSTGLLMQDPISVAPGIVIAPSAGYAKYVEERRFDRYTVVSVTASVVVSAVWLSAVVSPASLFPQANIGRQSATHSNIIRQSPYDSGAATQNP